MDADENPEDLSLEVKTPYCHYSAIHILSALFIATVFVLSGVDFNLNCSATTSSSSFKRRQCRASPASIYRTVYKI